MTFAPENGIQNFISTDVILPEDDAEFNLFLTDRLKKMIRALNDKEVGQYSTQSIVNGETWFDANDATRFRYGQRVVVDFGALPNAATTTMAHNIPVDSNTRFTRIYGTSNDPSTTFIPLPYVDMSGGAGNIELTVDATNVTVTTTGDYSAFTETFIVLEWVQNN